MRECLDGNEDAWAALLRKYKNLIFSIPIKQGMARDDAADIFQRVCILLLAELAYLRQPQALPMWLIRVTSRECSRWRRQERPHTAQDTLEPESELMADDAAIPDQLLAQVTEEQTLRDAVRALSTRCQQLVDMLFFEAPSRPYREVARALGLAEGSIGFIRGRCLARLRRALEKKGFK